MTIKRVWFEKLRGIQENGLKSREVGKVLGVQEKEYDSEESPGKLGVLAGLDGGRSTNRLFIK